MIQVRHQADGGGHNENMTPIPPENHAAPGAVSPLWHALETPDALHRLQTDARCGLTHDEAARRLHENGPNALPEARRESAARRLARQFHNVLIHVLLVAAGVTAVLGHALDTVVILGVVLVNAVIGFMQEGKAQGALQALQQLLPLRAQVLRQGRRTEVAASALVPGDIVFLAPGDKVPADLRLLQTHGLRVQEAALTGESLPVDKQSQALAPGAPLAERVNMAYSATLVAAGQGSGVVVATGEATEMGRISRLTASAQPLQTPLLRQMAVFGWRLTLAILALALAVLLVGHWGHGLAFAQTFMAAVGLAVAAIPEGLPAVLTITLALGVQRMARRNTIVRRLPVVEALGAVTVICTDKTGTLTRNEMTAQQVLDTQGVVDVFGVGYAPQGGFARNGQALDGLPAHLQWLALACLLCNDAELHRSADGEWTLSGDPTEGALLTLALKAGLESAHTREAWPRTDVIPFDAEHRFMATLHHNHEGQAMVCLKGAPERVLGLCAQESGATGAQPLRLAHWERAMATCAAQGMRLLAVACREQPPAGTTLSFDEVEAGGFVLLGVLGLADPPREEARAAVVRCREAGIRVKMITGDHAATATAIGRQLGLGTEGVLHTLGGSDIDALDDEALEDAVARTDVFARASPEHKLRLVQALQRRGEVVAMTGDGVNDAPALRRADVGVAMGHKGTDAAKEAAEMVLADDHFATIAAAVEEGRAIYDNIRKAIAFALPTNGAQAGMLLVAVALGMTLPVTPVQILWVNLLVSVTLALSLAFDAPEPGLMQRPPRPPGAPLLSGYLLWRIVLVSVLLVSGTLVLHLAALRAGDSLETARTLAVNALMAGQLAYLFNVRALHRSAFNRRTWAGHAPLWLAVTTLAVLQVAYTYWPAMQQLFGSAALQPHHWLSIAVLAAALFLLVELEKHLLAHRLVPAPTHPPHRRGADAPRA